MNKLKITKINENIQFDNGAILDCNHRQDCCEHHYLDFDYVKMEDVEGLEFDLSGDNFFKRIDGYGIELIPINGFSVKIPGYGSNNGYYSTDLTLELHNGKDLKTWDITECQVVSGG